MEKHREEYVPIGQRIGNIHTGDLVAPIFHNQTGQTKRDSRRLLAPRRD